MKKLRIGIAVIFLSALFSCEKELDIEYHDIPPLTVIEGELTPEGIKVAITLTTPMDEPMDRTRLTDATVSLADLTAGVSYTLTADADGYYTDLTPGVAGHEYCLTVRRDGNLYESVTRMYEPTEVVGLEFNWIKMPYDYVAVLQGQFLDAPGYEDYYWVKIYRNGEMYRWVNMTDNGDVGGVLTFVAMTSRKDIAEEDDDTVLRDGDVISVTVSAISRGMYDYIEALQNDSNGPCMFTGNKCLGYFIATFPVAAEVVFRPDEIPVYK